MGRGGRTRTSVLLAAAVGAAMTAGCSPPADELPVPELLAQTPSESPLDAAFARIYGLNAFDPEDMERQDAERRTITENFTAECMADQGFEYVPFMPAPEDAPTGSFEPPDAEETLEQAKLVGYGIVEDSRRAAERVVEENPNDAIRANLSAPERAAYDRALDGFERDPNDQIVSDDDGNPVEVAGAGESCAVQAQGHLEEVQPQEPDPVSDDPVFIELNDARSAVSDRVSADPRISDLDAEWSTCMAEAGYSGLVGPSEAWQLASEPWFAWVGENVDADGNFPLDDPEVVRLEQQEITIAVDDATCQLATDYLDRSTAIRFTYEHQVVDQYADDIDYLEQAWARG